MRCSVQNTGYKGAERTWKYNSIKKGIETTKKNQSEMKDTVIKVKSNLQGLNSKVDEAKNSIINLEYKE